MAAAISLMMAITALMLSMIVPAAIILLKPHPFIIVLCAVELVGIIILLGMCVYLIIDALRQRRLRRNQQPRRET